MPPVDAERAQQRVEVGEGQQDADADDGPGHGVPQDGELGGARAASGPPVIRSACADQERDADAGERGASAATVRLLAR